MANRSSRFIFPVSVETFTHQGWKARGRPNHYNEDRLVAGSYLFAVIDGSTAVEDADIDGMNTSAWMAENARQLFLERDRKGYTAQNELKAVNAALGKKLAHEHPDIWKLGRRGPCAAAAVVKLHPKSNTMTYATIADCMVAVFRNGRWEVLNENHHEQVDSPLTKKIEELAAKGMSADDIRAHPDVQKIIRQSRENNAAVLNGQADMDEHVQAGSISLEGVSCIVIMSDGMFWPAHSGSAAIQVAADYIDRHGMGQYYRVLKSAYDRDADYEKFPRAKHIDDATAIMIRLQVD